MTTKALEELDGGLGSCQAGEDLSVLADPYQGRAREDKAQAVTPRRADLSNWPHDFTLTAEGSVDTKPKKMEKVPPIKGAPSPSKETLKAGATPRSAPARKKSQVAPPPQPPPPPPLYEELPWGDLSLNKCLALASLVALLGLAFQLCHDAVTGKVAVPEPAPKTWVPPSAAPKVRQSPPPPKPVAWTPTPAPPAPQEEGKAKLEARENKEVAEEKEAGEAAGNAQVDRGSKEKPPGRKEERPRKERQRREKEASPRKERPRADRELRSAPPGRREARQGAHKSWVRDSGDPERSKRAPWTSKRRGQTSSEEEERHGRQPHRPGKGRD
ncbi:PREDICTED: junctional sarcoplasmic reticulum protein 1 [Chrysochloris asiatica]|uniref:Junctional sarcoplasmic reticulum protein 1 n=1 Tax=Chrysochloris asiatica TaxID=185453 RepID=A0A9B0TWL3_CHRAS|nr:PREDICTED: junctional sarcoplasmic reticulum protein 1 [Chrysochloris asiatica]